MCARFNSKGSFFKTRSTPMAPGEAPRVVAPVAPVMPGEAPIVVPPVANPREASTPTPTPSTTPMSETPTTGEIRTGEITRREGSGRELGIRMPRVMGARVEATTPTTNFPTRSTGELWSAPTRATLEDSQF